MVPTARCCFTVTVENIVAASKPVVSIYVMHTECNVTDLGITTGSGTVDPKCTNRGFSDSSSFPEGVICYNGVTAGSTAIYICDDGFVLVGNEARVCQSDGSWNDRTPQCISQESGIQ